ncbi:hypothetical protein [Algoriphagus boritolerans]|uniref:hypothetical protein n=1 Tax=Algoriphagus boritolerans TaxID=308111 RepID=UPI000AE2C309
MELDVTKGVVEISPETILAEFGDNCGIKSLTINKNKFTCEDIGKEIAVAIRAEDHSGNVSEAVSIVTVNRLETEPVALPDQIHSVQEKRECLSLLHPSLSKWSDGEETEWRFLGKPERLWKFQNLEFTMLCSATQVDVSRNLKI